MVKAVLYLRVSLDVTGEMLAVERQREACQRIAQERHWRIVGEYMDNSLSASKKTVTRPEYERMRADYAAGLFDAIVVWDLDRLTRQPRQLEDWIDLAQEHGLMLVTANGEADLQTDAGRLFARIKAAVAREEVERKGARQRAAARQRVERGTGNGMKPAYGYTSANEIIPEEAEVVRSMFRRFYAGETLYSIRSWLDTSEHRPHQGKHWAYSTLRAVLTNPRYVARVTYHGEVTGPGTWTPIVDGDIFDAVQAKLNDPRRRTNHWGTHRKYLGSGLFLCGVCGRTMNCNSYAYVCPDHHLTRARDHTDAIVLGAVEARLKQVGELTVPHHTDPALNARLAALRARLQVIESDYDTGLIDGHRFKSATATVHAQIREAEKRLRSVTRSAAAASILDAENPVQAFRNAPLSVVRATVDAMATVRLLKRAKSSGGRFDPASVKLEWRR